MSRARLPYVRAWIRQGDGTLVKTYDLDVDINEVVHTYVNSEKFEALMANYRTWPGQDPQGVIARFEEVKMALCECIEMFTDTSK